MGWWKKGRGGGGMKGWGDGGTFRGGGVYVEKVGSNTGTNN